jgi:NTP pyrophosphatase (non-canonical NTP hydrolase)
MPLYTDLLKNYHYQQSYRNAVDEVVCLCAGIAEESGWDNEPVDVPRSLMLIVSEIAEAMEGDRKKLQDDKLPHREMFDVELADAVIRIFHLAGRMEIELGEILVEKLQYNIQRADHKPENRVKEGGKSY